MSRAGRVRSLGRPAPARALAKALAAAAALALLYGVAPGAARGAEGTSVELRRLFPKEAEVTGPRARLLRLTLTPEVLASCRPDLSDLRLFDAESGREIPYLVDARTSPPGGAEVTQRFVPQVFEAARDETRPKDRPPRRRERFVLGWPEAAPRTGGWTLVAEIAAAEFVARLHVDGIDAGGGTTPLVEEASLFRLGGPRPAVKIRVTLPPFAGRRFQVTVESEQERWLAPAFRLESDRTLLPDERIAVPLEILSSRSGDGRTVVEVARPRGLVPDLLRLRTSTATFDRPAEVWDEGPARSAGALGSGRLFRIDALVPVGEEDLALRPPSGDRLRITIDDGDSPPLANLAFDAVLRRPSLVFAPPAGRPDGQPVAILRFGGGRAHPPRYDLATLLPPPGERAAGSRAAAAALLYDPKTVGDAALGPVRDTPGYDGAPALAFAMHPGAAIDRRRFSHVRPITLVAAPEGLSRFRLQPEDLAILRDDLSDLRVADGEARQWPYLIDRDAGDVSVPWEVHRTTAKRVSHYELHPPAPSLRFDRVVLEVDAGFFDRGFALEGAPPQGNAIVLARGRLTRPVGDPRSLSLEVAPRRVAAMTLAVEDGDDAPLALRSVATRAPLPDVYLTAPPGRYDLLLGSPDEIAPRYELERARDVVLAVNAVPAAGGALAANRDYSLKARLEEGGLRQTAMMWAALIGAVVILAALTLRLARRGESPGAAGT